MVDLAGVLIYLLGLGLLFLELFIPSAGLLGIGGTLCTLYGIWQIMDASIPAGVVTIVVTAIYLYVILSFWGKRITMGGSLAGSDSTNAETAPAELLGQEGVTTTVLRPVGFAQFGDLRAQVVTDGSFLPKGRAVRVVEVVGNRVVVTDAGGPPPDTTKDVL